jgi:hypothetical protein
MILPSYGGLYHVLRLQAGITTAGADAFSATATTTATSATGLNYTKPEYPW